MGIVLINELRRDGNFTNTEYLEFLLTTDVTATTLQTLIFGDSQNPPNSKLSAYQFNSSISNIAPTFKAGTIIAVGGATAIPTQDITYNPVAGGSDDAWNIQLQIGGSYLTTLTSGGDFAASDVAWVDTSSSGTTSIDSIAWPTTVTAAFGTAAQVKVAAPANGGNIVFTSDLAGVDVAANYTVNGTGSLGLPNGGTNTTYINNLRSGASTTNSLSLSITPSTFSEAAGNGAATSTITRSGATTGDLTVNLVSSDTTEATIPATVTILNGQASATFGVNAVDDTILDGSQNVTLTASATGFSNGTATVTVTDNEAAPSFTPIFQLQGSGTATTFSGNVTTEGIVVGDFQGSPGLNGFFIQDPTGDGNDATSDGIFVFTPSANSFSSTVLNVGDRVSVTGRITEFNTLTEIDNVTALTVLSTGNTLPAATTVLLPETTNNDIERYEGMLVTIPQTLTVDQNFFQGRFGQVTLSPNGRLFNPTNIYEPNSTQAIALADQNARSLLVLDDGNSAQNPNPIPYIGADNTLRAGDTVAGLTGVLDYGSISSTASIRDYRLHPTVAPSFTRVNNRTTAPDPVGGNLKVASFNVLNYFTNLGTTTVSNLDGVSYSPRGATNSAEFTRQRDKIISAITAINADVLGVIEIENNGSTAISNLVAGLNAVAGAGTYDFINDTSLVNDPNPQANAVGTDAIKVGIIYKPGKVTPVGLPTTYQEPNPASPVFNRPPVAQTFSLSNGEKFTAIVNHFKSKSADGATGLDLDQGDGQGAYNNTRKLQAQAMVDFVATVKTTSGDNDVLVIGDLNAYGKEDPIRILTNSGLVDELAKYVTNPYSFVFDGQAGYLDHALASASLDGQVTGVTEWHINTDEPSVIDYNTEFKPQDLYTNTPYRSSDHDPVIVGLNLASNTINGSGQSTVTGTTGNDRIVGNPGTKTLTSGDGNDVFVYNSIKEAGQTIADFTVGSDRIDLSQLLDTLVSGGYNGTNALADGYVQIVQGSSSNSANSILQIDRDGSLGSAIFKPFLQVNNITATALGNVSNFVF